eukprot:7832153-Lingulodinium_polyedra.AAC.1
MGGSRHSRRAPAANLNATRTQRCLAAGDQQTLEDGARQRARGVATPPGWPCAPSPHATLSPE